MNRKAEIVGTQKTVGENAIVEQGNGARAAYTRPTLERLGEWRALTLQMSIPIFP